MARLADMARSAIDIAGKARKFRKSLSGDNSYANRLSDLRADATNMFRQLKPREPQDVSILAGLISTTFSPTTKKGERVQAARDLAYALKTTQWADQEGPSFGANEGAVFPLPLLEKTGRGYLVTIGREMNGSFEAGWYDACAVMMRRLVEVCIIEAFEGKGLSDKIKKGNGDFVMLSDMIDCALTELSGVLSRNSRQELPKLRDLGHRSAHGRYFTAQKSDIDKVQSGCRVVIEEFLHIAGLLKG